MGFRITEPELQEAAVYRKDQGLCWSLAELALRWGGGPLSEESRFTSGNISGLHNNRNLPAFTLLYDATAHKRLGQPFVQPSFKTVLLCRSKT